MDEPMVSVEAEAIDRPAPVTAAVVLIAGAPNEKDDLVSESSVFDRPAYSAGGASELCVSSSEPPNCRVTVGPTLVIGGALVREEVVAGLVWVEGAVNGLRDVSVRVKGEEDAGAGAEAGALVG